MSSSGHMSTLPSSVRIVEVGIVKEEAMCQIIEIWDNLCSNPQVISIKYVQYRVQVGPRDGLQNEKTLVPTDVKVEFIRLARNTTEG